jgi:hypothetical protein
MISRYPMTQRYRTEADMTVEFDDEAKAVCINVPYEAVDSLAEVTMSVERRDGNLVVTFGGVSDDTFELYRLRLLEADDGTVTQEASRTPGARQRVRRALRHP